MEDAARPNAMGPRPVTSLASAVRSARIEGVERSQVVAELRGAEMARLEMLKDAVQPVLAQVPQGMDLFDAGIVPGEHPRLFIDMIGFVEMGRDRRTYRLVQDTRHGRVLMAESDKLDVMEAAVTNYIARRMVERERALASDATVPMMAQAQVARAMPPPSMPRPRRGKQQRVFSVFRFLIEFLGVFTLGMLVIAAALAAWYFGYPPARAWLAAQGWGFGG